jgi:hypothetical protein
MKLKECSSCKKMIVLWKANPKLCKTCWLKIKPSKQRSLPEPNSIPAKLNKSSTPIKNVSDKKLIELKEYRIVRDRYLKENPVCEFEGCGSREVELHHKKPRAYHLCDISVFMSVCRRHHTWIHDHDAESREMGLLMSGLSK